MRAASTERLAWLGLIPVAATALHYAIPHDVQRLTAVQFIPQVMAYLSLAIWAAANERPLDRLGLLPLALPTGLRWGVPTGLLLGALNVAVMLWLVPSLGGEIQFLRDTPHARLPMLIMLPWFIIAIALFVEINFRGFLLGRLVTLLGPLPAILLSAVAFSFDPFMTGTFRHLHWIAVWDGIVWGALTWRLGTLWPAIIAHAVEVIVMYSSLKAVLQ